MRYIAKPVLFIRKYFYKKRICIIEEPSTTAVVPPTIMTMITEIIVAKMPRAEIIMPAMEIPRPLPPTVFDLFRPIMLKIKPRSGKKKAKISPAIAIPLLCDE